MARAAKDAGGLDALEKRFAGVEDGAVESEREQLKQDRRAFARGNRFTRDDAHSIYDERVAAFRSDIEHDLTGTSGIAGMWERSPELRGSRGRSLVELRNGWAFVNDAAFHKAAHRQIDAYAGPETAEWSPLTRAEINSKLEWFDSEIEAHETELARRGAVAQMAAAQAELERVAAGSTS